MNIRVGLISACVALVFAVIGITMFAYHRSAIDGGALPTVKGYWRAPSIQAAIFDDSYHHAQPMGVELEKVETVKPAIASPIHNG